MLHQHKGYSCPKCGGIQFRLHWDVVFHDADASLYEEAQRIAVCRGCGYERILETRSRQIGKVESL